MDSESTKVESIDRGMTMGEPIRAKDPTILSAVEAPEMAAYTESDMTQWVILLMKRSTTRRDPKRRIEDVAEAQRYLSALQSRIRV